MNAPRGRAAVRFDVPQYHFRQMVLDDLPLVRDWLARPHVREWWGDPDEQFGLVSGDMNEPAMDQYIVSHIAFSSEVGTGSREENASTQNVGMPFGYLQCYRLTDWNICFGLQPEQTRGIDQMIGVPEMVGCGHGSGFIRAFIEDLLASGTPRVVVDPAPANARAIRAYEKAGFIRDKLVDTPDGISLLMVRDA
jgi:aminoglycoside 6'-N-acetyltransferase